MSEKLKLLYQRILRDIKCIIGRHHHLKVISSKERGVTYSICMFCGDIKESPYTYVRPKHWKEPSSSYGYEELSKAYDFPEYINEEK